LVSILGNFVQRVFVLCHKYYDGRVPEPVGGKDQDLLLWSELNVLPGKISDEIDRFRFRDALASTMQVARAGNKYLTDTEPWKLEKTDPERVRTVLYNSLRITAALSVMLEPFLPFTAGKLRTMLGLGELAWDDALRPDLIKPGAQLGRPEHLFKPIDDTAIAAEVERLHANKPVEPLSPSEQAKDPVPGPGKSNISFDEFSKLDLRIGTIIAAEKVAKADKLLKLTIDIGEAESRTVVSGIAMHYAPEQLPGQQVLLLCNLEPRKLKGIESQGMVLMAGDAEGKLRFVRPGEAMPNGSEVR
ncbi:MAG TPA: methionine--tRNA ligase subunit beta, partial [Flavobacteriales bacterium]|nr:methionine--tRNA ligase subunit beta [Flavobacteriales bacterium]